MKKDNNKTQVAFNQKRNTVCISSKDLFAVGSVWIADMLHVPFRVSLSSSLSCPPKVEGSSLNVQRRGHSMAKAIRIHRMFSAPSGLPSALRPQPGP